MILIWILAILLLAGVVAWLVEPLQHNAPRWIALAATVLTLAIVLQLWIMHPGTLTLHNTGPWIARVQLPWIPSLGIQLHLAMDGLSLLLVALTLALGIVSIVTSWREIQTRQGFFHFNLLWSLAGAIGVFLALDLFLFTFFWEVMLVPMYFIIAIWGHEQRRYAAVKFFIFTQVSGLLMLVAIIGLVLAHYFATNIITFNYFDLLDTPLSSSMGMLLMLGFLAAFLVKLPAVPFHTWLPDAHTQAPTAGSIILAGVLLKTGGYGLIRFAIPLFPTAAAHFAPVAMILGVIGILYGAVQAFSQTDLKRLVAYTSVSHLGFVLLAVYAWNTLALQGAVVQMLAHGISTGALFMLVGQLQERLHSRDLGQMGGLWSKAPRMGAFAIAFAVASLGMPGLANFIGEFMILFGTYLQNPILTTIATLGLIAATAYALILIQRAFHGIARPGLHFPDLSLREMCLSALLAALLVWLGIYPQPLLDATQPALSAVDGLTHQTVIATRGVL